MLGAHIPTIRPDNSSHVSSVAITVVWVRIRHWRVRAIVGVADKIVTHRNAESRTKAAAEVRMIVIDAGVNDSDANTLPRKSQFRMHNVRARHRDRGRQFRVHRLSDGDRNGVDRVNTFDIAQIQKLGYIRGIYINGYTIE